MIKVQDEMLPWLETEKIRNRMRDEHIVRQLYIVLRTAKSHEFVVGESTVNFSEISLVHFAWRSIVRKKKVELL